MLWQVGGLGSVRAISDGNAVIVERYSYDVFGEPNRASGVGNLYMLTGRGYDPDSGLRPLPAGRPKTENKARYKKERAIIGDCP